jgi:hypothetical protein
MSSLFAAIDANTRQGTAALVQTLRQAKRQVAENRLAEVTVTQRLAALLLAAQYETRLHWLLSHPDSRLSPGDIASVRGAGGLAQKWNALLRTSLAMRTNSSIGSCYGPQDIPTVLDPATRRIYRQMNHITTAHLDTLIDMRNSLAHGEWSTALTRNGDGINTARTTHLRSITLYRIVILTNLLEHLWKAHYDAQVTHAAFERDFNSHAIGMVNAAHRLERGDEAKWLADMRRRYKNGRTAREALTLP